MAGVTELTAKSLVGAAVSRSRAFSALVPTAPGVIRGRAPGAERCEILFLVAPWGLCVFVPRRHRPQPC